MPSYLISGLSGSGKSTIGRELSARGYPVIHTDEEKTLSAFYNRKSGKKVSTYDVIHGKSDWFAKHDWNWDGERLKAIIAEHGDRPVFFCGGANNDYLFYPLFARCFVLLADDETLTRRLRARNPEQFNGESASLSRILEFNKGGLAYCRKWGMIPIDASREPQKVADDILALLW